MELLQTFADQAVIAIENVRLFTELQARNRDLTEALDRQTATGEILRVIASSPTDEQPVFEAIVRSALRLLDGYSAVLRIPPGQGASPRRLYEHDAGGRHRARAVVGSAGVRHRLLHPSCREPEARGGGGH